VKGEIGVVDRRGSQHREVHDLRGSIRKKREKGQRRGGKKVRRIGTHPASEENCAYCGKFKGEANIDLGESEGKKK